MGSTPHIAIACCRASYDAHRMEVFPDPDSELLVSALAEVGVAADMVSWDDPHVAWVDMDLVLVRSTWDSVDRPVEYLRWAQEINQVSILVNPLEVLAWNLDKAYLGALAEDGIPVVPTQFVQPGSDWEPPEGEFVVKPTISAGGRETARYAQPHLPAARTHVSRLLSQGRCVMVQPYLRSVADPGEISLVFLDGRFSHAVRKGGVLEAGADIPDRPWERMVFLGAAYPTDDERALADHVHTVLGRRFDRTLAYSRVDLLAGGRGEPLVLEVELIDPNLSLSLRPEAVNEWAARLRRQLTQPQSSATADLTTLR